jgi:hypothetical protein
MSDSRLKKIALLVGLYVLTAATADARIITLGWDASPEATVIGYKVHYGTQPDGLSTIVDVGNVVTWQVDLSGPQYYFAVLAYDADGNESPLSLEVGDTPNVFLTRPLDQHSLSGSAAGLLLQATGSVAAYSATNLPPALGINSATGAISGIVDATADQASPYIVTARASDASGNVSSVQFIWTVTTNHVPIVISPGNGFAIAGTTVTKTVLAWDPDGDPITFSADYLPGGLAIDLHTGVISGSIASDGAGVYNVLVTASDGVLSGSAEFTWTVAAPGALAVDQVVFADGFGTTVTTPPFSTSAPGETLLAFVTAAQPTEQGVQTASVSGGGLTWTLVTRANTQAGSAEIWRATATDVVSNIVVTETLAIGGDPLTLTVVAFAGAGGVGAFSAASAPSGAPTVSLTTTAAGSFVFGAGNDWDAAVARTPAANQEIVHESVTNTADTYWVQRYSGPVQNAGTLVTLSDTEPTADRFNFVAVEIIPLAHVQPSITATPVLVAAGATITATVQHGPGNRGDWIGLFNIADSLTFVAWSYLNGLQTLPATGLTNVTVPFNAPSTPGQYNFRLFAAGDSTRPIATSNTVRVSSSPTAVEGRMFGCGGIDEAHVRQRFAFRVTERNNREYGRLEYWSTDDANGRGDDNGCDGDRDGDYGASHRGARAQFQSTAISSVAFSDDPAFAPGRAGRPAVDSVVFSGTGKWNGKPGYLFQARATDQSEPGRQRDTFSLVVKDASGATVATVAGTLAGGNIQSTRLSRSGNSR